MQPPYTLPKVNGHSFIVIMANSPEYKVMISSTKSLVDAMVAGDPKAISDDLVG